MIAVRRAGTASATALSALVVALGLGHAAAPKWVQQAGLDVWNLSALREAARAGDRETEALRLQEERLFREIETTDHVATRLVAGTVSLAEATDATEPFLRERPGFVQAAAPYHKAPSFRLSVARYLIHRIERLDLPGDRYATVKARLEAEYAAMR